LFCFWTLLQVYLSFHYLSLNYCLFLLVPNIVHMINVVSLLNDCSSKCLFFTLVIQNFWSQPTVLLEWLFSRRKVSKIMWCFRNMYQWIVKWRYWNVFGMYRSTNLPTSIITVTVVLAKYDTQHPGVEC
jgi:hypothetical protein